MLYVIYNDLFLHYEVKNLNFIFISINTEPGLILESVDIILLDK